MCQTYSRWSSRLLATLTVFIERVSNTKQHELTVRRNIKTRNTPVVPLTGWCRKCWCEVATWLGSRSARRVWNVGEVQRATAGMCASSCLGQNWAENHTRVPLSRRGQRQRAGICNRWRLDAQHSACAVCQPTLTLFRNWSTGEPHNHLPFLLRGAAPGPEVGMNSVVTTPLLRIGNVPALSSYRAEKSKCRD